MKKGISGLPILRQASSLKEQRKDDHFSYFQNLEQKLLYESEKLTNLIGLKALAASETRSVKQPSFPYSKLKNSERFTHGLSDSGGDIGEDEVDTNASMMVHSYLQGKRKLLSSSKSQYFGGKEKEGQLQRKLTYNMVRPQQQVEISPSKSQQREVLKMTTSTSSSSAALQSTIEKIKRMSSKPKLQPRSTIEPTRSIGIEDFQILKYMQEGQFGTVYLSRHKATNFLCALKKIPKRIFQGQQRFINQLVRQVKIQSYLDHPNIVQLYTFFSDEESLYLILQLCCGGNVYSTLRNEGRFSEEKTRSVIKQACYAVQFMHDSDIIHRDIKPQNILFHQNIIKVCDFGWSIHSPLLRETRCGTPLYSSPEVVQKQQYDNKVDVWNIGILTYELLFGRVPFEIRTQDDLVKVVDEDIYFSKGIPVSDDAKHFILSCLHKNPKERMSMNKLVDHPFIHRNR